MKFDIVIGRGGRRDCGGLGAVLAVIAVIAWSAVLAGCGSPPPVATPADAARGNVALAELERGRSLLITRCSSCHRAPLPNEFRPAQWPDKVADMAERAGIDRPQRRLIEQYLMTMSIR